MIGIDELITKYGVTVPEESAEAFMKDFHANYKSVAEVEKKDTKINSLTERLRTAEDSLKGFEGVDPSKYQEEISKLQNQLSEAETKYNEDIYKRDFDDALNRELGKIKFTSSMAKKAVTEQLRNANLTLTDGKIYGFQDKLAEIRETDADAFVDEAKQTLEDNKVKFTGAMGGEPTPKVNMDDYRKLPKDGDARREFIKSHPELFARN